MYTKPKGTYDLVGEDVIVYNYINSVIDKFTRAYNYQFIRTPIFESSELFHRSVGESSDIVSKETYDFKDRGDRDITLRPEGTAGVVRSFIENKMYGNRNDAIKLYYNGTMYRYERPQAGRYRELSQFGVEVFGSNEDLIDAEVISMGYFMLEELGVKDTYVAINSLGDKESRSNYTEALKEYLEPHLDSLCDDCKRRFKTNPLRILDCKVDGDSEVLKNAPVVSDYLSDASKKRFESVKELLMMLDVDYEVDEKLVRGLDYYDENVWEFKSSEGISLGGGGRYNSLVSVLGGPDTPAIGFAFGLERLMIEVKKNLNLDYFDEGIDVYIMCVSEEEKMYALRMAQDLRLNDFFVEVNSNNLSLKSQFKVADNLKASFLIILNDEDLQKGIVKIKDNVTKEEESVAEDEVFEWITCHI